MKQFLLVTFWEFIRHFKSRGFLLATFISPLVFSAIILIPSLYMDDSSKNLPRIVGCIEFDTTGVCNTITNRLLQLNTNKRQEQPFLLIEPIKPDTSLRMKLKFDNMTLLKSEYDSLNDQYIKIKERRKYIFQRPKTRSQQTLLRSTYEEMIRTREARDLAKIEFDKAKRQSDSLWRIEMIQHADKMINNLELEGYLLIDLDEFANGIIEFHSLLPANFLEIQPIKQVVQVVVVEHRLTNDDIRVDKIEEWLEPIVFKEIQLQGEQKQEFDFMVNYLGPVIVVLFLFISIFTSSGFLFGGVLREKTGRVLEILLSSVSHYQLVAGKIFGLGILGIFQIVIWFSLTLLLIGLNILNVGEIGFLNLKNAGLFLLYFVLGYLFFASIFVGLGSLFSNEEDAHHLSQFMRMLSIFPIVLAVLVLETPNSTIVRVLSFIPPLIPTFMILRTPLGNPPTHDYLISIGIMVFSILVSIFFAGKLFKIGSLLYGKRPKLKEIASIFFNK